MPGGRPKKELDKATFEELCSIQCTKEEICNVLKLDQKTLTRWCEETYGEGFSHVYEKLTANGKQSLRRAQFKMAQTNPTMAIWLGKQVLGQSDKTEAKVDGSLNIRLEWASDKPKEVGDDQ